MCNSKIILFVSIISIELCQYVRFKVECRTYHKLYCLPR